MALRGETIGRAYVKILADGSGFGDSVRDELRDEDGSFRQLGKRHSEAYDDGFNEQIDDISKRLVAGLEAGARRNRGRFDAIGEQIGSDLLDPIDKQFRIAFGDEVGKQMSKDMREAFFGSGGASDTLDDFIEDWNKNWVKATDTVDKQTQQIEKMVRDQQIRLTQIEGDAQEERRLHRAEDFRDAINRIKSEVDQVRAAGQADRKEQQETQKEVRKTNKEWSELVRQIRAYHKGIDQSSSSRKEFRSDLERLAVKMRSLGQDTETFNRDFRSVRTELDRTHPVLAKMSNLFDDFGDHVGRAFGKGSRNNFLNFFGSIVGAFSALPGLIPKAAQGVSNFVGTFKAAFDEGGILGVVKKFGVTIGTLGAGLGALAVVMGGVVVITGVLSSALLSLLGAAVALASSLAFALGGAIAVVAGALVPLVAGVGVAILAFQNMDKKTKKAFSGIKDAFKGIGKDAAANIFGSGDELTKKIDTIKDSIKGLGTITGPVSKAMGEILDGFLADLQSSQFKDFEKFLGQVLPDMIKSLGAIAGNLGSALAGIFTAIAPFVQQFLDSLVQITGRFAEWTNSAQGQNSIEEFMHKAKRAAEPVLDALGQIIGLIGDLFDVSESTGNGLFRSIANTIQEWRDKLQAAERDGTLKKWFTDAGNVARAIGDAVVAVGKFIAALDTPENRKLVEQLANAFIDVLNAVAKIAPVLEGMFNLIVGGTKGAKTAMDAMKKAWQAVGDALQAVYNNVIGPVLSQILKGISNVLRSAADMVGILSKTPGLGWLGDLSKKLNDAADRADHLSSEVNSIPDSHTVTITVLAPSQATIDKINAQLGQIHGRAVTITPQVSGGGGGGGGGNGSGRQVVTTGNGRTTNMVVNVHTPTADPKTVAHELLNHVAAAAYI